MCLNRSMSRLIINRFLLNVRCIYKWLVSGIRLWILFFLFFCLLNTVTQHYNFSTLFMVFNSIEIRYLCIFMSDFARESSQLTVIAFWSKLTVNWQTPQPTNTLKKCWHLFFYISPYLYWIIKKKKQTNK